MPFGNLSKTISANMPYQFLLLKESISTFSIKCQTPRPSTSLKSFRNSSAYPKKRDLKELLLFFWQRETSSPNCWTHSGKSKRPAKSKSWKFFSMWFASCSTPAISSCTTNCSATNRSLGCWASWNVLLVHNADDPNFRNHRPKHREFINSKSRLMEVVPFRTNPDLLNLVVFTYRL